MVLILDGSSELGANKWSKPGLSICWKHLVFASKIPTLLHTCATCSELYTYICSFCGDNLFFAKCSTIKHSVSLSNLKLFSIYIYRRANGIYIYIYIPKRCKLQLMNSLSLFSYRVGFEILLLDRKWVRRTSDRHKRNERRFPLRALIRHEIQTL